MRSGTRRGSDASTGARSSCPEAYEVDLDDHLLERRLALLDAAGSTSPSCRCSRRSASRRCPPSERPRSSAIWEDGVLELVAASAAGSCPSRASRPRDGFVGVSVGADAFDDLDALAPVLERCAAPAFLFVHPEAGRPVPGAPGLVAGARRLHGPDAARVPRVARGWAEPLARRQHRLRDPGRWRADPPRAARLTAASTSARSSTRTSSSTRRRTAGARSSCASRRSASSGSSTAATCR